MNLSPHPLAGTRRPRRIVPVLSPAGGFSLIEVMVALLVLSVGMLGIAALHGQALSASGIAIKRGIAIDLAGNMADRIRANRNSGAAYAGPAGDNGCGPGDGAGSCTPAAMAAHDLYLWETEIAQSLPGGTGSVTVDQGAVPTRYTVSVSWDEPSQADPVSFALEFQLQSF